MSAPMANAISPLTQGFLLCASIVFAFGPQNLFILRQGLRRQHLFATALSSTLAHLALITVGVGGLSALISTSETLHTVASAAGVLFLLWCGVRSLRSAFRTGPRTSQAAHSVGIGAQATIVAALGFSFLNPWVYFDTLVVIGSKSLGFPTEQRIIFGIGAVLASAVWFFALTYGASKLSPVFRSQMAWRALDFISGGVMLFIAATMFAALRLSL